SQAYADLAKGLVCSVRDAEARQGRRERVPIQVIDIGLSDAAVAELAPDCQVLRRPPIPVPSEQAGQAPELLLSKAVKPLIRDLFPGYGLYLWLDSDTWVQNWWAIEWLCRGARSTGLALVPELDRSYMCLYQKEPAHLQTAFAWMADAFGEAMAHDLA